MKPTEHFCQIPGEYNDRDKDIKALILYQWYEAEGWEHEDLTKAGGEWREVSIVSKLPGRPQE